MRRVRLIAPRLSALLAVLVGATAAGTRLVDGPSSAAGPQLLVRDARGALAIDQSKPGRAIVSGDNLQPGSAVRGRTVVENAGGSSARIVLASMDLRSSRGPGNAAFADVLRLRVRKRTPHNRRMGPRTLYEGSLSAMPPIDLGGWRAGGSHRFTFRVSYPDRADGNLSGADASQGDANAWQASQASVTFTWTALAGELGAR